MVTAAMKFKKKIKKSLFLGRKTMRKFDSILKKQRSLL